MRFINSIIDVGKANGWHHIRTQDWCINFEKHETGNRTVINVYWDKQALSDIDPKFHVQTAMNHPKKGKTQLNRRGVTILQLEKIFENPRYHTGKGYFVKQKK